MSFSALKQQLIWMLTYLYARHSALFAPSALDGLVTRNEPGTWFSLKVCAVVLYMRNIHQGCDEFVMHVAQHTPTLPVQHLRTDCETDGFATSKTTGQAVSAEMQASMPVVFRVSAQDYRMWAYGRELTFSPQYSSVYGRSGYFTSTDGVHWKSVAGMHVT